MVLLSGRPPTLARARVYLITSALSHAERRTFELRRVLPRLFALLRRWLSVRDTHNCRTWWLTQPAAAATYCARPRPSSIETCVSG